jgi:hypothetical protein
MTADRTIADALRDALTAEADAVRISPDALGTIRGRIDRRQARWWSPSRPAGLALAGAAAAVLLAAGVATAVVDRPAHRSGPGPGAGAGAGTASATPSAARGANLPVYYLGPARLGNRLYREYHVFPGVNPSPQQAVAETVQAMLGRPADDPDYRSPWPAGATVRAVSVDAGTGQGATVSVDLSGAAGGAGFDATVDASAAAMAVQQLVWTVTAVAPGSTGVRLLLDGVPATTLWGAAPASGVLHRGQAAEVLAPIWVIDPQQETLQGHRFTVRLAGVVFEATMRLRVRDGSGAVVHDDAVHLSGGAPAQGTATVELNLPSGRYTIEGYLISERDGTEQVYDDHQFTIG